ncbi:serine/threonine-protein kinase [Streptomyces sp. NBC_00455]|uniref:serine/threonine-protein kinase n=1 Tax=Streptomyces sp. NBC_00455 TaxID=2903654 RepID=UPI002E223C8A
MEALRPQDPLRIGAHALLARLGAGGMGQVYLGRSPGGRLVAIKVIRDEIADHPEALGRFRREVETVRAVRSAYTANLIEASLTAPPYWLATECVSGPTLGHAVRRRGPFPVATCRGVFAGLAPGTPGFAAPEVLMTNQVGPAADVFALGSTMAYAATGRAPFGGGQPAGIGYRVVHEDIDLDGVEPELAELIGRCVAKDPAARPSLTEVIAVAAGVFVAVRLMPGGNGSSGSPAASDTGSGRPSGKGSGPAADKGSGTPSGKVPTYIADNRVSLDSWALSKGPDGAYGVGQCRTFGGESDTPAEFQTSVTNASSESDPYVTDKAKIEFRFKYADIGGKKPDGAPYYVSVGVKSPDEIDPGTGKPFSKSISPMNKSVGYTSKPLDAYAHWKTGGYVTLTYPDDFENHPVRGSVEDSIPVSADPGDWTVVFYHVKSTPTDYASISCSGFRVK